VAFGADLLTNLTDFSQWIFDLFDRFGRGLHVNLL